jgi:CspA family cold shock protein
MEEATVRKWDDAKGWGFLTSDAGEEYFVHHSSIQLVGHRSLTVGERVVFERGEYRGRECAVNVRPQARLSGGVSAGGGSRA